MNTFRHMTYDEWIIENPEVKLEEEDCIECDGTGEVICDCCGGDTDCDKCDGTGKLNSAHRLYENQIKLDNERMSRYLKTVQSTPTAPAAAAKGASR